MRKKGHNKAMEKLAKAKEQWYEENVEKKNEYMKKLQEYKDAKDDPEDGNRALDEFHRAHEALMDHELQKPTIHEFYKPSDEMKVYQDIVMG